VEKNFSDKAARIISTLFVPPSFTILIFTYFAFHLENNLYQKLVTIITAFVFGFALQIILFVFLRKMGKIIDIDASVKEERTVPFLISIIFYIIGLVILVQNHVNLISTAFWFCYITNTFIVVIINRKWKISAHAAGAAGPLAAIFSVLGTNGLWFMFLFFVIGWARIKLKCHNFLQVIAGGILGFVSTYIQIHLIVLWQGYAR
jgi:membrane-associated phospholipid phosphatase